MKCAQLSRIDLNIKLFLDLQKDSIEVYVGVHNRAEKGAFNRVCRMDFVKTDYEDMYPVPVNDIAILTLCEVLEFSESKY